MLSYLVPTLESIGTHPHHATWALLGLDFAKDVSTAEWRGTFSTMLLEAFFIAMPASGVMRE
jgi:hypothetical protein